MTDNLFTKASAIVLTAAGVLGVSYGIAKYVTDFETAKGEIQNLRGQIVQLHEVMSKMQFGADPARIERLETQVNELGKAVATLGDTFAEAMTSGANAAVAATPPIASGQSASLSIEDHLRAGGIAGSASDGNETWPFRISDIRFVDGANFEALVEWTTMDSKHRIKGDYSDARLFFKETEFIRKGRNNVLGCEYTLTPAQKGGLSGTFGNCDGSLSSGTVEIR